MLDTAHGYELDKLATIWGTLRQPDETDVDLRNRILGIQRNTFPDKIDVKVNVSYPDLSCTHEWKTYMGLTQQFDYCEKCDEKRNG